MTQRQYYFARLGIVMALSMAFSASIAINNYWLFILSMVIGGAGIWFLKKRVEGVSADERDYAIAGKAARYAITIFSLAVLLLALPMMFQSVPNSQYGLIASVLCYAVCLLMIIYSIVYRIFNRELLSLSQRIKLWLSVGLMLLFVLVLSLRFLTPEDNWVCQNGQWVIHGNPDSAQTSESCN